MPVSSVSDLKHSSVKRISISWFCLSLAFSARPRSAAHKPAVELSDYGIDSDKLKFKRIDGGRAKTLLAGMHEEINPQSRKRAARQRSNTLSAMLEAYLAARGVKQTTAEKYRAQMRRNLSDWLEKPITEITPQMVLLRYEAIVKRSIAE